MTDMIMADDIRTAYLHHGRRALRAGRPDPDGHGQDVNRHRPEFSMPPGLSSR